jgi:small subunit ribosomal protein S6
MSAKLDKLREYETLVVLNPELTDEATNQTVERLHEILTKMKATLLREEKWGKRKLSFDVKKHSRGTYVLLHYVGDVGVVEELERTCRNLDQVIRFLTTLNGDVSDIEAKRAEVEKLVAKRAEREKERAEAEAQRAQREERGDDDDDDDRDRDRDRDRGRDRRSSRDDDDDFHEGAEP